MARKQRSKGKGPGGPQAQGAPSQQRPQGGGGAGGGWGPLRDSVRRDIEQAVTALAFAERLHQKLDTQRRVFLDFPRAMEQLRSGALERVTVALSRIYEGGQGFDLQRFLRDLPLALAHLAAADRSKSAPPPEGSTPPAASAASAPTPDKSAPPAEGSAEAGAAETALAAEAPAASAAPPETAPASAPSAPPPSAAPSASDGAAPVNPRLELRAKLLAAAPQLAKAATSYRRNVATLKRAALPRRSPGPWRADREVLEEARRAVEFVQKLYDAYAEAWADQPLTPDLHEQTTAELDRFLAWTQLDRYVELAVMASTNAPRPPKPGQQIFGGSKESVPPPVTEGSPGAGGTVPPDASPSDAAGQEAAGTAAPEEKAQDAQVSEPEPGRA